MFLQQSKETKSKSYLSVQEILTSKQEQDWIDEYAENGPYLSLQDFFEKEAIGNPDYDYEKIILVELELIVYSNERQSLDLHVKLEQGEKAILYTSPENSNYPFSGEFMYLLVFNNENQLMKKFVFNDEFEYLYSDYQASIKFDSDYYNISEEEAKEKREKEMEPKKLRIIKQAMLLTNLNDKNVHFIAQDNN